MDLNDFHERAGLSYWNVQSKKKSIPTQRKAEIPTGRGVLKAKILEAKYEGKLEFPGRSGVQNKKPSMGGVWILSGTAQYKFLGLNSII